MAAKVVQWATGGVGTEAVKVLLSRDDFELVGIYVYNEDKVGKDAADIAGLANPTGVKATNDIEEIIALKPDCISYMPLMPEIEHIERFLNAGINVVSTANFFRGDYMGAFGMENVRERIDAAGKAGNAAFFAGGYNPGYMTLIPMILASIHSRVDLIEIHESGDLTDYESGPFFDIMGWGIKPAEDGNTPRPAMAELMDGFLFDGLDMVAEACGFEVTDRVVNCDYAITEKELVCAAKTFEAGTIAGQSCTWEYKSGDKTVISMTIVWYAGDDLVPNLAANEEVGKHSIVIHGEPTIEASIGLRADSEKQRMADSMIGTAMSALNAVTYVCERATPGMHSLLDAPPTPGLGAAHWNPPA